MIWYFAYGSNLLMEQMIARTGPLHLAVAPRIVRRDDCRLAFNMRGQDGQLYANLRFPGEHVLGVIYRCDPGVLERLDPFEEGYHRERITVVDSSGTTFESYAYIANRENIVDGGAPCAEYVQRILRGGRQHGLPETYLRGIEKSAGRRALPDGKTE